MASYAQRALHHPHPVAKRLFDIAESKQSNLIISADLTTTQSLLQCADNLGPYIVVFKTHIDIVADFSDKTVQGLKSLAQKHNFLIFEDRKLVDIGNTVKKQYHEGALRLSEWADIVNLSILGGDGIIEALDQTITNPGFPYQGQRALLLLAEMTSEGSLATDKYTDRCASLVSKYPGSVIGFVATRSLTAPATGADDFLVFTTGIHISESRDQLGQQYQSPARAISRGTDFIIVGRGIYGSDDPVGAAERYRKEGWAAYVKRSTAANKK